MAKESTFRPAVQKAATAELASFAFAAVRDGVPRPASRRVELMLFDMFGVTLAGMRTPELRAVANGWRAAGGPHRTLGGEVSADAEAVAYLDAIAACCLELDEGNKYAMGHPAAHVVFAAVAAARGCPEPVTGERFLRSVAVGYEVAARFGSAVVRDGRWHTHGHWGATGAACASATLLGADADQIAAAIDVAGSLMHVTPWATVLEGNFARNLWVAGANRAGLDAARLAIAGVVGNTGSIAHSLGELVGTLDAESLVRDLGATWLVERGYAKRHACCSYTHAAIDAVQLLKRSRRWDLGAIDHIDVGIHSLAEPLFQREPRNRLSAMFSLPFVVAAAAVDDHVGPSTMEPGTSAFAAALDFSRRVRVRTSPEFDRLLPRLRCAEVTVRYDDGHTTGLCLPNPIGDADHFPLGWTDIAAKLELLVGVGDTQRVKDVVDALAGSPDVVRTLSHLP